MDLLHLRKGTSHANPLAWMSKVLDLVQDFLDSALVVRHVDVNCQFAPMQDDLLHAAHLVDLNRFFLSCGQNLRLA